MDRRHFLAATGGGIIGTLLSGCGGGGSGISSDVNKTTLERSAPATPPATGGAGKSRVIVIGGGMGGAAVAKYLRLWGDGVDVTLIERQPTYTSCIMSSLVLTGQRTLASLAFDYDKLRTLYGINTVFDEVVGIDPVAAKVTLASGGTLAADRIVMAPGIEFDDVPGLGTSDKMPHAWKAGPQTALLAGQLKAMPAGGVVVLTIPKAPYRCPPGPYERACLLADWLKRYKPGSKLIVLDANPDFVTEKDNFTNAFLGLHGSVIDYHTNVEVTQVDPATMTLTTTGGAIRGDVVNLIPRQRAGSLVTKTGLNNATEGRFAGVDVLSYASTVQGADKVHIIGDSSATTQPKAGHIANQEGQVCADAVSRILVGQQPDPAPVTNSACFSTITMQQASWLTAVFQYDATTMAMKPVAASSAASSGWNSDNFQDMGIWFKALMGDTFA
ncbi:sulfide dehydrogenase [flavocytochrome c] flavoprotein chain precursor [mine drainage metagenome]|uniref:Sulfide dehydrogenase [flavocytochrome c] flavoprotein chain n=1 Tax=mine drainage metagenome TaxID=410659 RepID=A0A1J5PZY3_9ZZZZ